MGQEKLARDRERVSKQWRTCVLYHCRAGGYRFGLVSKFAKIVPGGELHEFVSEADGRLHRMALKSRGLIYRKTPMSPFLDLALIQVRL